MGATIIVIIFLNIIIINRSSINSIILAIRVQSQADGDLKYQFWTAMLHLITDLRLHRMNSEPGRLASSEHAVL